MDLAGGWTDTPPVSFEAGGAVTNIALLVDGVRPIGAACEITDTPTLEVPRRVRVTRARLDVASGLPSPVARGEQIPGYLCIRQTALLWKALLPRGLRRALLWSALPPPGPRALLWGALLP